MAVDNAKLSKILFLAIIVLLVAILIVYFIAGRDTITYPAPEEEEVVTEEEFEDGSSLLDTSMDEDVDMATDTAPEDEVIAEEPEEEVVAEEPEEEVVPEEVEENEENEKTEETEETEEVESYDFITAADIGADINITEGADFEKTVSQLDTPEKLIVYLNGNFVFEKVMAEKVLYPEEFFAKKKGNSWDFALFSSYVLRRHGYETGIIRYKHNATIRAVATFGGKVAPRVIVFSGLEIGMYEYGFYTSEMITKEEKRLGIKITEYALSYWTDSGDLWPESWIKR